MLKILSLNIESDKRLDHVAGLLQKENADAVFLQEVLEKDVSFLVKMSGAVAWKYIPLMKVNRENNALIPYPSVWGMLAAVKIKPVRFIEEFYAIKDKNIPELVTDPLIPNSSNRVILGMELKADGRKYEFLSTHFTWADKGGYNGEQLRDLTNMMKILDREGEYVLCGDFNSPRGGLIYNKFTKKLKDNIPPEITTTLDNDLHRVKNIKPLVVDYIFTTPAYKADNVRVISGVSDHKAIVANVSSS